MLDEYAAIDVNDLDYVPRSACAPLPLLQSAYLHNPWLGGGKAFQRLRSS